MLAFLWGEVIVRAVLLGSLPGFILGWFVGGYLGAYQLRWLRRQLR